MSDEKPKTGAYRLGSAFLWAAVQGSIAWFAMGAGLWKSWTAARSQPKSAPWWAMWRARNRAWTSSGVDGLGAPGGTAMV